MNLQAEQVLHANFFNALGGINNYVFTHQTDFSLSPYVNTRVGTTQTIPILTKTQLLAQVTLEVEMFANVLHRQDLSQWAFHAMEVAMDPKLCPGAVLQPENCSCTIEPTHIDGENIWYAQLTLQWIVS